MDSICLLWEAAERGSEGELHHGTAVGTQRSFKESARSRF